MIWFTIVSIVIVVLCIIAVCALEDDTGVKVFLCLVIVFVSTGFGTTIEYHNSIKPIEVYRGNTEIKVKYTILDNDTIKCDTIIFLKNRN